MLGDPAHARWSITAIAFAAGFRDLSSFNRSFRRRYSASLSDVRRAACEGSFPRRLQTREADTITSGLGQGRAWTRPPNAVGVEG
jgi:AraC-like DNA-binding protein